ncbi:hypothetical protein SAMN04487898_102290 [Pedobacter sp. ok626]|uniref:hypothetical protein n=1 Tax=Pedobacter sp. ok626 TaxID=1761882 RepID=UPI00088F1146|nr:hypothetical protein [Pedobacter sp. ok626]SDJ33425.1 hypothetical protein SAMN04487898_102290 [Pedobacter sp. ok626]
MSATSFVELKEKFAFNKLKISPSSATFGENIYSGNTPENEGCFLFEYHDNQKPAVSFIILSGGKSVFYHYTSTTSQQSVQTLLRGNITKFCIQEQGKFCLHASSMCIHDQVVLFIGQKGAGKSTLATYFHLQGHAIWCDDYALLRQKDNCFFAFQGETSLKINPDIATALAIPQKNLKPVFDLPAHWKRTAESDIITNKHYFNQQIADVEILPRKVAAIFFINKRVPKPANLISIRKKSDALSVLMDEILLPGINSKQYLKLYFQSATRFLDIVPSYTIHAPDNISRIHEVYDSVLETIKTS